MTLRHPVDWLESMYWQSVGREQIWAPLPPPGRTVEMPDPEQWYRLQLAASDRGELVYLDYAYTIDCFRRVFGDGHVHVFLYEALKDDFESFVENLCGLLEVDAEQGLELTRGRHLACRITERTEQYLRHLATHPEQASRFYALDREQRKSVAHDATTFDTPVPENQRAKAEFPKSVVSEIERLTREGNRMLKSKLGADLRRFNYPL